MINTHKIKNRNLLPPHSRGINALSFYTLSRSYLYFYLYILCIRLVFAAGV